MAETERSNEDLSGIERSFARLSPTAPRLNRDQLFYEAGRASVIRTSRLAQRARWFWPATSVLSTSAAVMLAALLVSQPRPAVQPPAVASGSGSVETGPASDGQEEEESLIQQDRLDRFDPGEVGAVTFPHKLTALNSPPAGNSQRDSGAPDRRTGTYFEEMQFHLMKQAAAL